MRRLWWKVRPWMVVLVLPAERRCIDIQGGMMQ
jgi:hypothetical protein